MYGNEHDNDLIETLWNVKRSKTFFILYFPYDLIETLWNVKRRDGKGCSILITDLIETLWNVKEEVEKEGLPIRRRFNRDIVECKVYYDRLILGLWKRDLIETLWNVKYPGCFCTYRTGTI